MEISEQKVKAYWNRPGGPFKILAALVAFGIAGFFALPILTTIVWNTINFGIACGVAGLLLFLVTNKRLRLLVQSVWDIIMNNTFGLVFVWDPFVLWRLDIKDMEETQEKARQQAIEVDTQKESIQSKIDEKKGEMNKLLAKGQVAKKNNMMDDLGLISDQIQGYREYITQLSPMLANLSKISTFLDKFDKNAGRTIQAAKTKLSLRMDLYKSTTAGNKAINSTLRFFKGDPEKRALLEQSADAYRQDISSKLANMKKAISLSGDYMRSIDLDKAASEEQGLKMLDAMDPDTAFTLNAEVPDKFLPKETVFVSQRKPGEVDKGSYDNLIN
jgi:phage shock protein A